MKHVWKLGFEYCSKIGCKLQSHRIFLCSQPSSANFSCNIGTKKSEQLPSNHIKSENLQSVLSAGKLETDVRRGQTCKRCYKARESLWPVRGRGKLVTGEKESLEFGSKSKKITRYFLACTTLTGPLATRLLPAWASIALAQPQNQFEYPKSTCCAEYIFPNSKINRNKKG